MAETELLTDSRHTRSDLRLLERAVKNGWDIPEALLSALPKIAGSLALNGAPRERIRAMEVLIKMKAQNEQLQPQPVQQVQHTHVHELGPVTADNIEQHRQLRLARIAGSV